MMSDHLGAVAVLAMGILAMGSPGLAQPRDAETRDAAAETAARQALETFITQWNTADDANLRRAMHFPFATVPGGGALIVDARAGGLLGRLRRVAGARGVESQCVRLRLVRGGQVLDRQGACVDRLQPLRRRRRRLSHLAGVLHRHPAGRPLGHPAPDPGRRARGSGRRRAGGHRRGGPPGRAGFLHGLQCRRRRRHRRDAQPPAPVHDRRRRLRGGRVARRRPASELRPDARRRRLAPVPRRGGGAAVRAAVRRRGRGA